MTRTDDDKFKSLQQLQYNVFTCSPFDAFGGDNIVKINTMIDVIKMNRSIAWINSTFLNVNELLMSNPDNVIWQSAIDARAWLDGECELEDLLFPVNREYSNAGNNIISRK